MVNWLKELAGKGLSPLMDVIENCSPEDVSQRERHWIEFYRNQGNVLVNSTNGGCSIYQDAGPDYMGATEAADYLGISRMSFQRLVETNIIQSVIKPNPNLKKRKLLFLKEDVLKLGNEK